MRAKAVGNRKHSKRSAEVPESKPTNKGTPTTRYVPKKHQMEPMIRKMAKQNWSSRKIAKLLDVPLALVERVRER